MTDWSRLSDYIFDYFPDPIYSSKDIRDWASGNVPAWKVMKGGEKDKIIKDWENFVAPKKKGWVRRRGAGFRARIRKFLGRNY